MSFATIWSEALGGLRLPKAKFQWRRSAKWRRGSLDSFSDGCLLCSARWIGIFVGFRMLKEVDHGKAVHGPHKASKLMLSAVRYHEAGMWPAEGLLKRLMRTLCRTRGKNTSRQSEKGFWSQRIGHR